MALIPADLPQSQIDAVRYFGDAENCHNFMVALRWPDGIKCAHCQSDQVGNLVVSQVASRSKYRPGKVVRRVWNCKACKKQFTTKTGTIFEDSALGLDKWLPAVWLIVNAKNGVSSCELARSLGITQKSAWHMGHRIRSAMHEGVFNMAGEVEADETYIGGRAKFMHTERRQQLEDGTVTKVPVLGILERSPHKKHSRVFVEVVKKPRKHILEGHVRDRVQKGSNVYTDALPSYTGLKGDYFHAFVDHSIKYVEGAVHTNSLENFWSLLKRSLKGTYVQVTPSHLFRYLDEQATRFNERKDDDAGRFLNTMMRTKGHRLPYRVLTANVLGKDGMF